jgi:hypothetical protein
MRLWTLHPRYLDSRGLVALWREALLAQAVLQGLTKGYKHHPQLIRFSAHSAPIKAIAAYLRPILAEAVRRRYHFDGNKIVPGEDVEVIAVTSGQMDYEWAHLREKLRRRAPLWLASLPSDAALNPHPLFHVVQGEVENWEAIGERAHSPNNPRAGARQRSDQ